MMKPITDLSPSEIRTVFTDIDGTLTTGDKISSETYESLWFLKKAGVQVVPVTGRPAGWCELIARQWPVHGVIGENGAFYFRHTSRGMERHFFASKEEQIHRAQKLQKIQEEVLASVNGSKVASDQFSRLFDLAIDFAEDVHPALDKKKIDQIVEIFEKHGATCKVSHIHVNGWFGDHEKGKACFYYAQKELALKSHDLIQAQCLYVGDSPNDEPLFERFKNSVGVANVVDYKEFMKTLPQFVTLAREGEGFVELTRILIGK